MRIGKNIPWFRILILMGSVVGGMAARGGAQEQLVWNGKEWVSPAPAEPGTPEGDLADLRQRVAEGRNRHVVKAVEQFLVHHGESPACEEAMNLAGQSLLNQGDYWAAYKWYERQISTYPNGAFFERALDREYLIADAFLKGRKRRALKIFRVPAQEDGLEILTRISAQAPGTAVAERSLLRVADYHYSRAEYGDAVKYYEDFLQSHPLSEQRKYVMLQIARSYLLSYRGVEWDIAPLLDARKRYQLFAQAYPEDAEKENVDGILEEIRLGLAQKVYHTGRFYERIKQRRAAAFYYRKTIEEYGDTHWANSARGRLDMLGPLPTDATPFVPSSEGRRGGAEEPDEEPATPPEKENSTAGLETSPETGENPPADLPTGPEESTAGRTAPRKPRNAAEQPVPLEDLSTPPSEEAGD